MLAAINALSALHPRRVAAGLCAPPATLRTCLLSSAAPPSFCPLLLQAVLGLLGILVALYWTIKTQMGIAARQRQTARGASTFETYKQVPGRGW